jgi:hypothetical protein
MASLLADPDDQLPEIRQIQVNGAIDAQTCLPST